jgi:hypothetical protein
MTVSYRTTMDKLEPELIQPPVENGAERSTDLIAWEPSGIMCPIHGQIQSLIQQCHRIGIPVVCNKDSLIAEPPHIATVRVDTLGITGWSVNGIARPWRWGHLCLSRDVIPYTDSQWTDFLTSSRMMR